MAERLLEICIDTLAGLGAALRGGADRIELCGALDVGGLTPSGGLMRAAAGCGRPVHALIRPRAGDFCFAAAEVALMCEDISLARSAGLQGVVIGAALPDGRLDLGALGQLAGAARGMDVTLHRVFDLVPDRAVALEQAVALGFDRILTSGGALTAPEGADEIARLVARAGGRIVVQPGGGISAGNVGPLLAAGARQIHASCGAPHLADARVRAFGFAPGTGRATDEVLVRALKRAIAG